MTGAGGKVGWLTTGNGEGSLGLLRSALHSGADIRYVACTREPGEASGSDNFIRFVEEHRLPLVTLSWRRWARLNRELGREERRTTYESELLKRIRALGTNVPLVMMAGYMLITRKLHRELTCFNLHPATPDGPKGTWETVIHELIRTRATHGGVTIHRVTDELDSGPAAVHCRYPIAVHEPAAIREIGLRYERALLAQFLALPARATAEMVDLTAAVEGAVLSRARA